MGPAAGCDARCWRYAERLDRVAGAGRWSAGVSGGDTAAFEPRNLASPACVQQRVRFSGHRRSVARPGDSAAATLLRLHHEERSRPISRLLLVLFHERARVAFPWLALP